jgi:hypothetical protein
MTPMYMNNANVAAVTNTNGFVNIRSVTAGAAVAA